MGVNDPSTMSLPTEATRVFLASRPNPNIDGSTFRVQKVPMASLQPQKPSEVLVKVDYISLDPAMRGWLDDKRSYIAPVQIGDTMRALVVATVVKVHSESSGRFKVGDAVRGVAGTLTRINRNLVLTAFAGWTDYAIMEEKGLVKPRYGVLRASGSR